MSLTKRIIGVILLRDGRAVKGKQFDNFRDVGNPVSQARILYANGIDEILVLNTQPEKGIEPLADVLPGIGEQCFIPINVGGGIRTFEHAKRLIAIGAEKVTINTESYYHKDLLTICAEHFGAQSVCVGIDVRRIGDGFYDLASECGKQRHTEDLFSHIQECEDAGAGEFFIQAIDNDGLMQGLDMDLLELAGDCTDLPIVACGGIGNQNHVIAAFKDTETSGIAMASIFAFTDYNPTRLKSACRNAGISVRK